MNLQNPRYPNLDPNKDRAPGLLSCLPIRPCCVPWGVYPSGLVSNNLGFSKFPSCTHNKNPKGQPSLSIGSDQGNVCGGCS